MILPSVRSIQKKYSRATLDLKGYNPIISTRGLDDFEIYDWFPYTQRFTSEFLRKIFCRKELVQAKSILDPFMGSANTLVACEEFGKTGFGVDVSPLSLFIARAKTIRYSAEDFSRAKVALNDFEGTKELNPPSLSSFERLFDREQLSQLLALRNIAYELPRKSDIVLLFALVSKLIDFSKARRYGKGLHLTDTAKSVEVKNTILRKIESMEQSYSGFRPKGSTFPILSDARELPFRAKGDLQIDTVLTSPPYCNSSDYIEMYKLEHWFLNFVSDYHKFRRLSHSTVRSHTSFRDGSSDWNHPAVEEISSTLSEKELWDRRIPSMIRGYFDDLHTALDRLYEILAPEGRAIIVVGNSCFSTIVVPTDLLVVEAAEDVGFSLQKIEILRHLFTSGQQWGRLDLASRNSLRESVVTLIA